MLDIDAIKYACTNRWPELLGRIGGVPLEVLDGKNHPCPKCGGKDRFRMIDREDGALLCNQCFDTKNGDGIAAVMWLTGLTFPEACERLAAEVGLTVQANEINVIEEMAWRKNINADSLRAFGAAISMRGNLNVCRLPMYDADMQRIGNFDMSPVSPDFEKGKAEAGCRLGLFIATKPAAGDHVLLVEGVKDAAALGFTDKIAVGLPTCRMDAAFARMFRDCHVTIIPDRDKAGLEGANETAARLYGVAASVKIAELPAEYKESGGSDVRDVLRQRDGQAKVIAAIEHAKSWLPEGKPKPRFVSLADAVVDYVKRIKHKQVLVTTGLPGIDKSIGGGVMAGEMVIVAGRPSHGKTMVGLQALDHIAKTCPVLMISEEMPIPALCERSVESISDIEKDKWEENEQTLLEAIWPHYATRQEIKIIECCMTIDAAIDAIESAQQEFGIGAVCVDYVQRLRGKGATEYDWVSESSARLKQVAMKNNLVFLALCQLNRGVEQRASSSPRMSDLRSSGQLEQDADVILFVEYLYRTDPNRYGVNDYRILVAKNRNRSTSNSVIECVFKPDRQRLYAKDYGHDERMITENRNYHPEFAGELF